MPVNFSFLSYDNWNIPFIVLASLFFAFINTFTFSRLASLIHSFLSTLFGGASYQSYRQKWTELADLKVQITTVSAMDEFAKWAKLQRKIDGAQAAWDKENGERQRKQMGDKMKLSLGIRVLYLSGMAAVWWSGAKTDRIRVPVLWRLSGERAVNVWNKQLMTDDGFVPAMILFTIFNQSFNSLFSLVLA